MGRRKGHNPHLLKEEQHPRLLKEEQHPRLLKEEQQRGRIYRL